MNKLGKLNFKKKDTGAQIIKANLYEKRRANAHQLEDNLEVIEKKVDTEAKQLIDPEALAQQKGKTATQIQHDLVRLKRLGQSIEKKMEQTYRQKIEQFNKKIQKMPEHYDIPKVGPG